MNLSNRLLILSICALSVITAYGQKPMYETYTWDKAPEIHKMKEENKTFPAVVVSQSQFSEIVSSGGTTESFQTEHKVLHINSDAGVERYNKVYLPMGGTRELVDLKVRAIDAAGKVTNFRKENLKELENVDGYRNFKIFAIEGVSVGGEIEYIYTIKSSPQIFGREVLQSDIPVLASSFVMIFPDRLHFETKCYNGLAAAKKAEYDAKRTSISVAAANIPALPEEEYSSHRTNLMRFDFKMVSNGYTSAMLTWSYISEHLLKQLQEPRSASKVEKLIKSLNADKLTEEQKVQALERYVKTKFTIKPGRNEAYEDLKTIVSTHVANEEGILKLYLSCLAQMGIGNNIVYTSSREDGKIDPEFSSPMDLSDGLIFFPKFRKYLTPARVYMRLGAAPDEFGGNNGLFVTYDALPTGELQFLRSDVLPIPVRGFEENTQGVNATVKVLNDMAEVTQENFWQGSRASLYRGIYHMQEKTGKEEFVKNVTISDVENFTLIKRELSGEDVSLTEDPTSYFRIKSNYQAPSLIEKAGDDYLVSIGKVIGKQSELYQEKQRMTAVDFHSTSNYKHELVLEIPEGYSCSGLEAIKINNAVTVKDDQVMFFKSDYKVEGDKLIISVNEVYKVVNLPQAQYNEFRAVVNSAADFNKLVVVLSPKK